MDSTRKVLLILGGAVAVILAGVLVGMLATSGTEVTVTSFNNRPPSNAPPAAMAPATVPPQPLPLRSGPPSLNTMPPSTMPVDPAATNAAAGTNDWSEQLDEILGTDKSEREKAGQLLALFPQLPKDGQEEVAQHLTNLVEDEDYAPLGRYLTNSTLSVDVLDVLFTDLFNRPNGVKLPLLVDVASDPKHPKAEEAKDLLELYLEEDYGTDWPKWRAKAQQWIKDNPE